MAVRRPYPPAAATNMTSPGAPARTASYNRYDPAHVPRANSDMGDLNPQQVARLQDSARRFNDEPLAQLRMPARAAVVAGGVVLGLGSLALGRPELAFALLFSGLRTPLCGFLVSGFIRLTPLFLRARDYLLGCRGTTWLIIAVGVVGFIAGLYFLSLLGVWLSVTLMALALGAMLSLALDGKVEMRRRSARESADA